MLGMRDTREFATHNHSSGGHIQSCVQANAITVASVSHLPMELATSMRKLILVTVRPSGVTIILCLVTSEDRFEIMIVSHHRRQ